MVGGIDVEYHEKLKIFFDELGIAKKMVLATSSDDIVSARTVSVLAFDEKFLEKDEVNLPIQINGKMKKTISVSKEEKEEEVLKLIKNTYPELINKDIIKIIYIPGRIINIICK